MLALWPHLACVLVSTPFVLVSKIRPGRCRYTYQLPLSSFLAEVTSLRSIKVKVAVSQCCPPRPGAPIA